MKFVIATGNEGKVREFKRILEPMGFGAVSMKELGLVLDVEETGKTFSENAYLKAEAVCRLTGLPAIADDSGLCVDALNGAPGVYSARYSGQGDDGNNQKLLDEMADVPPEKRTARYVSGEQGFGYDPLFYVGERSFGQYSDEEKDAISHRGKALRLFCETLKKHRISDEWTGEKD